MTRDDLDDFMAETDLELEARFQELEQQADVDLVRAKMAQDARWAPGESPTPPLTAGPDDPLRDLKAVFEAAPTTRELLLVVCPSCNKTNRLPRARALRDTPRCGACGAELVFRG